MLPENLNTSCKMKVSMGFCGSFQGRLAKLAALTTTAWHTNK